MEVIVRCEIPQHRLPLYENIISQEEIVSFLSLSVEKRIVVVALEALHHVSGVARPLIYFPICFHGID